MKAFQLISVAFALLILFGCSKHDQQYHKATFYTHQSDFAAAISIYENIVASDAQNAFFLNNLGWALFRNGDIQAGLEKLVQAQKKSTDSKLTEAIKLNLEMVNLWQRGNEYMENANFEAALAEFEPLIKTYGAKEIGLKYKALCLEQLGRTIEAKKSWEELFSIYKGASFESHYAKLAKEKLKSFQDT